MEKPMKAAQIMGKLRWKGVSAADRTKAGKKAAKARMVKISPKKRSEIASHAASSITPKAARARAVKAWETKRRKLLESQAKAS